MTTVEITNTEAEDLIRQRRQLAQDEPLVVAAAQPAAQPEPTPPAPSQAAPPPPPPVATQPAPAPAAVAPVAKKAAANKAAPKATPAPVAVKAVAAAPAQATPAIAAPKAAAKTATPAPKTKPKPEPVAAGEKTAESTPSEPELERNKSLWAQGFVDYEKHTNLAPGSVDNPTRRTTTAGMISGSDVTYRRYSGAGPETLTLGLLGGYINSQHRFSDTVNVKDAKQSDEGGFVGAYAAYQFNKFALDVMFKTDIVRHHQRDTRAIKCLDGQVLVVDNPATDLHEVNSGSVDKFTYTIGGNVSYRFDLAGGAWFEPVAGIRYSYTDYGNGAGALGLANGEVLRLQGGARIGRGWDDGQGRFWTVSLLGLLYSDVMVDGFTAGGTGFTSTASEVDEGKLRVMGQLAANVDVGQGWSFNGQVEVRGGEDLIGVGGRIGTRYEW